MRLSPPAVALGTNVKAEAAISPPRVDKISNKKKKLMGRRLRWQAVQCHREHSGRRDWSACLRQILAAFTWGGAWADGGNGGRWAFRVRLQLQWIGVPDCSYMCETNSRTGLDMNCLIVFFFSCMWDFSCCEVVGLLQSLPSFLKCLSSSAICCSGTLCLFGRKKEI